jgi:hypothetical protein
MTEPAIIVDRRGLASKLANRPRAFILNELLQNAWDENVTTVRATVEPLPGKAQCRITVEDDSPEGFSDLTSVYTMFKHSKKAPDPTKRGRFEMGEKLVIALALSAEVTSTKGTVIFDEDGRRTSRATRKAGTVFTGVFRMTREQYIELIASAKMLIPPPGIKTYLDGDLLPPREVLHSFEATLQTIRADADGNLAPTQRKTAVNVYEVLEGETAHIYEMGIPVVETGDRWHYDVEQRVPVNWERNNVPPAFLRTLRVEVLNAMHSRLSEDESTAAWVTEAAADGRCAPEAITTVVHRRFGDKVVIHDPSDPEGTKIAVSQGYTVIPGGAFSKGAWENVKTSGAALPAGQVTPSPKPYDENGRPENVIPPSKWTPDMSRIAAFAEHIFLRLTGKTCRTTIVRELQASWAANFGPTDDGGFRLCLNYGRLGKKWFALAKRDERVLDLLLHEFVHYEVNDHLSNEMHEAATKLGARLVGIALDEPNLFND